MTHKVCELEGQLLDAAVAKAHGIPLERRGGAVVTASYDQNHLAEPLPYSRLWQYGGPIIERERINLTFYPAVGDKPGYWYADFCGEREGPECAAAAPLAAAMRAYVASKFGEEIEL